MFITETHSLFFTESWPSCCWFDNHLWEGRRCGFHHAFYESRWDKPPTTHEWIISRFLKPDLYYVLFINAGVYISTYSAICIVKQFMMFDHFQKSCCHFIWIFCIQNISNVFTCKWWSMYSSKFIYFLGNINFW